MRFHLGRVLHFFLQNTELGIAFTLINIDMETYFYLNLSLLFDFELWKLCSEIKLKESFVDSGIESLYLYISALWSWAGHRIGFS